jgi:drug/metabolite transporter (DMT)-like permease
MEILKTLKSAVGSLKKVYFALGLAFVPVLTFADGNNIGSLATNASKEANSVKILIFNVILAVGAILILCGIITIFKKHVEHKWGKVAVFILVGAMCMMPRVLITTANQSTLNATTGAAGNTTQQFSAGGG